MLNHASAMFDLNGFSETVGAVYLGNGTIQGGNLTGSSYSVTNGTISANLGGASSALTKGGSGTVVLSGNNTFAGGVTIDAGVLQLGQAGALNSTTPNAVALGGGTLRLNSYSVTVADLSGNGVVENASASGATLTVNKASGSSTVTAILQDGTGAGALALTKTGNGTVTLSGANTYSGLTTISAGTLELDNRLAVQNSTVSNLVHGGLVFSSVTNRYVLGGLAGTGNIGLTNTAGSLLGLSVGSNGSNTTYSGQLSGDGSLTKTGNGTLILSGMNNHTGGTVISGGTLSVGADGNLGNASGPLTLDGGTLLSTASFGTSRTISNLAAGTFAVANATTLRVDGVIAGPGSLTKVGGGTLSLTASNTFTGNFLMQDGALVVSNQYALQNNTLDFTGGAVTFGANISTFSVGGLEGNQNLALTDAGGAGIALAVGGNGDSTTYSARLSGTGSLTKVGGGTLTLTGNNNYSGATVVSSGKLVVNGSLLTSTVTVNGGTLGGTGTVAGTMVVASGGHLAPGNSVGVQEYGTLTLESGGFLDIEFNTALSQTNDHFIVNNSGGLAINSGAKVNLYLEGGTSPFTDLGLYYLINYTGSPVDPSGLSVANNAFNRSYSFGTSAGASNWVVLTVGGAGRGWTGDSEVDAYWQTGANWVGGVAPVAFDQLLFDGNTRVNNTNNFAANTKFNGIAFTNSNGIGNFTLNGNTVNLVGNVVNLSGLSQTINLDLVLDGATRTFFANGTLTVNGDISDDGGARGLTKTGAGTLILTGSNSYNGETAVLGGVLRIAGAALPGSSLVTLGGGVVELSATNFARNLGTDPGEVRWTDDGGFSAYGGDRTVTINSGAALTWGQVNFVASGKTLKLGSDGANSKVVFSNPINLGSGDRQISVAGGWAEMSGGLSGSGGGLIKTGSGGLIVSGVNNYSGATVVSNGTLVVNGAITGGSSLTVASGALLMGTGVVAGVVQGAGAISPGDGPGILTVGQLNPTNGMSFNFEFTNIGSPDYTQPGASSNDVLRITNATTPFIAALALTNAVNLTISTTLVVGETNIFRGGFYTDAGDYTAAITNAHYLVNLGTLVFVRMTNDNHFAGTGYVMEFGVLGQDPIIVVPEPNVLALWLTGLVTITFIWRRHDRLKKRLDLA